MRGNVGVNLLVRTLAGLPERGPGIEWVELGTVQGDLSVKLDRFPHPIPKGDYLLARSLTLPDPMTKTVPGQGTHPHGPSGAHGGHTSGDGTHSHPATEGAHGHDVARPPQLAPIQPGDRVICVWANDGTDLIVLDVVVTS